MQLSYLKSTVPNCQNPKFHAKLNNLKIWKIPHLGIFSQEFEEHFCHIRIQCPQICVIEKFDLKVNIIKFRIKNA